MPLINDADKQFIQTQFDQLPIPVKLVVFTQEMECQFCSETRQMAEELAELSDQLSVEVYDFVADRPQVEAYEIDKIPAIAVVGRKDYGIRYYGIPAGYEFPALLADLQHVSEGDSHLMAATRKQLAQLTKPAHIQVFVSPT